MQFAEETPGMSSLQMRLCFLNIMLQNFGRMRYAPTPRRRFCLLTSISYLLQKTFTGIFYAYEQFLHLCLYGMRTQCFVIFICI